MGRTIIIKDADFSENGFKNLLKDSSLFTNNLKGYLSSLVPNILSFCEEAFWTYGMHLEKGKTYMFANFIAHAGCNICTVESDATPIANGESQFTTPTMKTAITHFSDSENNKVKNITFTTDTEYILFSCRDKDAINNMILFEL